MSSQFNFGKVKPLNYFLTVCIVLGLLFASVAGNDSQNVVFHYLQWQLQTLIPITILIGTHYLLDKNRLFSTLMPLKKLIVSGVIGSMLFTPCALLIEFLIQGSSPFQGQFQWEVLQEWLGVAPPIIIGWLALNSPWLLGYTLEVVKPGAGTDAKTVNTHDDQTSTNAAPPFYKLLHTKNRQGKLLLMKAELHYLKIVTDEHETLILYNLKDAISELEPDTGMQVHRSWWVAFDAIKQLTKRGREGELTMSNATVVPVSRSYLKKLQQQLGD